MGGGKLRAATLISTNTLNLRSPYGGAQHGRLLIRNHARLGRNVIIAIERGQVLCRSYDGCPILVRFDEGKARPYKGSEPADNSSEVLFLPYEIAKQLPSTKVLRVEVPIYQNGSQVLEFDVRGFDADRIK